MLKASYTAHSLIFKRPAGTSRGVLQKKPCWYIKLTSEEGVCGLGEVSFIPGLSVEDPEEIEIQIDHVCKLISRGEMSPRQPLPFLPGVQFALETAWNDLNGGGTRHLNPSDFTAGLAGIPTNGLIWMGDPAFMKQQIGEKLDAGFRVLKMKVGALDTKDEVEVLRGIRSEFGLDDLEIRLDANGAWSPDLAPAMLEQFAKYGIHSVEQPIKPGQWEAMAGLCAQGAIPVALDEELIGISSPLQMSELLGITQPAYLILKPGLLGGFSVAEAWIEQAHANRLGYWITSALESNLGLNALAQWTHTLNLAQPQGLGLGTLYSNNIPSPLELLGNQLWHLPEKNWDLKLILGN